MLARAREALGDERFALQPYDDLSDLSHDQRVALEDVVLTKLFCTMLSALKRDGALNELQRLGQELDAS